MAWSVVLLVTAIASRTATAQRLRGVVRDARSGQPVAGAIVTLLDAAGASGQQTITDRVGAFLIAVDSTARHAQVRRIGYLPWQDALPDSARRGTASLTIALQPVAATLEAVRSTAAKCTPAKGEGQALALFAQAELGMLATVVARQATPASVTLARYRRTGLDDRTMTQTVKVTTGVSNTPFFATLTPQALLDHGFTSMSPAGPVYHGLDPDLILSDASVDPLLRCRQGQQRPSWAGGDRVHAGVGPHSPG